MKNRRFELRFSEKEYELVKEKIELCGTKNMSAYIRKMAIDGMIVNLQMDEIKEINTLLRYAGNNINQIAKKLNESESIYAEDFKQIEDNQDKIMDIISKLYNKLAKL